MTVVIGIMGIIVDRLFGDPKKWTHPVIWIGRLIAFLEKHWNKGNARKYKGFCAVVVTVLTTGFVVGGIVWLSYTVHWAFGIAIEVILISLALAQKSLEEAAMLVYRALEQQDFKEAREKLGWIVGRDTEHLDESEIVRGVVETVSENTSDGVTAPLFYALLFGATGAWVYKAINTLDSMIAYKNERYNDFGFVAAKLDDVANFIPSRITGFLLLIGTKAVAQKPFTYRFAQWIGDARKHPSPNSGYLEAATAVQLGIRLGGENVYGGKKSFRAYMGQLVFEMNRSHIVQSIQQMYVVTLYFLVVVGGIIIAISSTWG
ncbi:adenosylcobinamide-phosphate synthase CbiB [Lysinibacillus sp. LZ02]|uniref:adenosylcobinamide-phosphate synthase CbiB n=1 Tax=Lysinibacillus sp. LZ02 TaxID=3420668 RepID=UPI003D35BF5A